MAILLRSCPSKFLKASILFLLPRNTSFVMAQDCEMSLWVFDTLDRCDDIKPPNAVGKVYADGKCRTVETSVTADSPDYELFPGTYRAFCTAEGLVRFHESGCIASTCSTMSFEDNALCDRDGSKIAALYSRLDPPEYIVQEMNAASTGGLYTCLRLFSAPGIQVTFVAFGDCSNPGCVVYGEQTPVPMTIITETPSMQPLVTPSTISPQPSIPATTTKPTATATALPTEPSAKQSMSWCFSGKSLVEVEGQGSIRMDALKIGDAVLTADGSYSKVYSFGHYEPLGATTEFLQIWTNATAGTPLEITPDHLLYVKTDRENSKLLPAGAVDVGDMMLFTAPGVATAAIITAITKVQRQGLFAPFTTKGNIVVNGVVASNYIALPPVFQNMVAFDQQHWLQHAAYTPHRLYCGLFECKDETYDEENGLSKAVMVWLPLLHFVEYILPWASHVAAALGFYLLVRKKQRRQSECPCL